MKMRKRKIGSTISVIIIVIITCTIIGEYFHFGSVLGLFEGSACSFNPFEYPSNFEKFFKGYIEFHQCARDKSSSKFVIVDAVDGLGNRLLSISSSFLYAAYTSRVLLIHWNIEEHSLVASLDDLFLNPGFQWQIERELKQQTYRLSQPTNQETDVKKEQTKDNTNKMENLNPHHNFDFNIYRNALRKEEKEEKEVQYEFSLSRSIFGKYWVYVRYFFYWLWSININKEANGLNVFVFNEDLVCEDPRNDPRKVIWMRTSLYYAPLLLNNPVFANLSLSLFGRNLEYFEKVSPLLFTPSQVVQEKINTLKNVVLKNTHDKNDYIVGLHWRSFDNLMARQSQKLLFKEGLKQLLSDKIEQMKQGKFTLDKIPHLFEVKF